MPPVPGPPLSYACRYLHTSCTSSSTLYGLSEQTEYCSPSNPRVGTSSRNCLSASPELLFLSLDGTYEGLGFIKSIINVYNHTVWWFEYLQGCEYNYVRYT